MSDALKNLAREIEAVAKSAADLGTIENSAVITLAARLQQDLGMEQGKALTISAGMVERSFNEAIDDTIAKGVRAKGIGSHTANSKARLAVARAIFNDFIDEAASLAVIASKTVDRKRRDAEQGVMRR